MPDFAPSVTRLIDELKRLHDISGGEELLATFPYIKTWTLYAMAGDAEKCIAAGMDAYLSKPLESKKLRATIEQLSRRPSNAPPRAA